MAKVWRIHVDVPYDSGLTDDQHNTLFTAIADAVHDWEPEHRNGWDTDIWSTTINTNEGGSALTNDLELVENPHACDPHCNHP